MKALEKVRERRYASVSDLAADIQRYPEDRPVLASPPNRIYLSRKLLRRHRMTVLGATAGAALLLLSGVTVWSFARHSAARPKLTAKDTIVLAEFDTKTGDPVFEDTLREGMSVELQQSPYIAIISDRTVQETLTLMGQPKNARLTPEIAQQVCERTGSAAVLNGSIALVGSQYVLGLRAKDCNTGNILDQQQVVHGSSRARLAAHIRSACCVHPPDESQGPQVEPATEWLLQITQALNVLWCLQGRPARRTLQGRPRPGLTATARKGVLQLFDDASVNTRDLSRGAPAAHVWAGSDLES
jgi:hypothetical protein